MITKIKAIIESMGLPFRYGNPSQINYYLNNVDYAAAPDGVAAYCYLLTDSEYINGKERATIAVFFSKLISFDFNGSEAVSVTDDCKSKAKEFLHQVAIGNSLTYQDARFQYGYNDFAENVAWCAVRAYFEDMVPDCVEYPTVNPSIVLIKKDDFKINEIDEGHINFNINVYTDSDSVLPQNLFFNGNPIRFELFNATIFASTDPSMEVFNGHLFYSIIGDASEYRLGDNSLVAKIGYTYSNELIITI